MHERKYIQLLLNQELSCCVITVQIKKSVFSDALVWTWPKIGYLQPGIKKVISENVLILNEPD